MNQKISLVVFLAVTLFGCSSTSLTQTNSEKTANASEQIRERLSDQTKDNTSVSSANLAQTLPITAKATISQETIELEVARTPQQQALGLMFRESLPADRGMLFPFSKPQIARFWMKNVVIPLDMIFLYQGEVKAIAANVPPCTVAPCPVYGPDILIDQVLELPGGRAKELDLQIGTRLKIKFFNNTQ